MKNVNKEILTKFDVSELEDRFEMKPWIDRSGPTIDLSKLYD